MDAARGEVLPRRMIGILCNYAKALFDYEMMFRKVSWYGISVLKNRTMNIPTIYLV